MPSWVLLAYGQWIKLQDTVPYRQLLPGREHIRSVVPSWILLYISGRNLHLPSWLILSERKHQCCSMRSWILLYHTYSEDSLPAW